MEKDVHVDKTYRGSSPREMPAIIKSSTARNTRNRYADLRQADLIRVCLIVIVLAGLSYLASPMVYTMRTEPVFEKARYVFESRAAFRTLSELPGIKSRDWVNTSELMSAARGTGTMGDLIRSVDSGESSTRFLSLIAGLLGGVTLALVYVRVITAPGSKALPNVVGLGVLIALVTINVGIISHYQSIAVQNYGEAKASVEKMLGLLVYGAILQKDSGSVTLHMAAGAPARFTDGDGATFLHLAAATGQKNLAEAFIHAQIPLDAEDGKGKTPVHYAARNDEKLMLEFLLENGARLDAVDDLGENPLHFAARLTGVSTLRTLLERKINPNLQDNAGNTALVVAANSGNIENLTLLLENGADTNIENAKGEILFQSLLTKVLKRVATRREHVSESDVPELEMLLALIAHGTNLNVTDAEGRTPLHWLSAACGTVKRNSANEAVIRKLIGTLFEHDVDYLAKDSSENEAFTIHLAALYGYGDWAQRILDDNPACARHVDANGKAPFQIAIETENTDLLPVLVAHGADMYQWSSENTTALHRAVENSDADAVRYLLEHGYRPKIDNPVQKSPLMMAAEANNVGIVRLLLEQGPGDTTDHAQREGPLQFAARKGYTETVLALLDGGVDITGADPKGNTALHLASREGHEELVRLLLKHGADPNSWNNDGKLPVHLASKNNHRAIAMIFKRR